MLLVHLDEADDISDGPVFQGKASMQAAQAETLQVGFAVGLDQGRLHRRLGFSRGWRILRAEGSDGHERQNGERKPASDHFHPSSGWYPRSYKKAGGEGEVSRHRGPTRWRSVP